MKSSKLHVSWSVHALTKRLLQEPQAPSLKLQAPSSKLQAPRKIKIDMKDNVGYIVFRTAAGDSAVFENGNGSLWDQLNASPPRSWRQVHRKNVQWGCDLELPGLWPFIFYSSPRHQASSDKLQAPSTKVQASSRKLQAPRSLNQGTGKYFFQQV